MRTRILAAALTLGVFGCAGRMSITATTPELVYIEPGIQVVVDSDVPIFYTDNYYWRYEGNVWYRSRVASGGWIRHGAPRQGEGQGRTSEGPTLMIAASPGGTHVDRT